MSTVHALVQHELGLEEVLRIIERHSGVGSAPLSDQMSAALHEQAVRMTQDNPNAQRNGLPDARIKLAAAQSAREALEESQQETAKYLLQMQTARTRDIAQVQSELEEAKSSLEKEQDTHRGLVREFDEALATQGISCDPTRENLTTAVQSLWYIKRALPAPLEQLRKELEDSIEGLPAAPELHELPTFEAASSEVSSVDPVLTQPKADWARYLLWLLPVFSGGVVGYGILRGTGVIRDDYPLLVLNALIGVGILFGFLSVLCVGRVLRRTGRYVASLADPSATKQPIVTLLTLVLSFIPAAGELFASAWGFQQVALQALNLQNSLISDPSKMKDPPAYLLCLIFAAILNLPFFAKEFGEGRDVVRDMLNERNRQEDVRQQEEDRKEKFLERIAEIRSLDHEAIATWGEAVTELSKELHSMGRDLKPSPEDEETDLEAYRWFLQGCPELQRAFALLQPIGEAALAVEHARGQYTHLEDRLEATKQPVGLDEEMIAHLKGLAHIAGQLAQEAIEACSRSGLRRT
jgi:hypothetical protein